MFTITSDKSIHITRGDVAAIDVSAVGVNGEPHKFQPDDIVRFKVFEKKRCHEIVLEKDVTVTEETEVVTIKLDTYDTRIGDLINKPVDYWYEVEVNPDTTPQTIIGYDVSGPKVFRLYPEGDD